MGIFTRTKRLEDIGHEHLQRCRRLASLPEAMAIASSSGLLHLEDLRRASLNKDAASRFLSVAADRNLDNLAQSGREQYVFYSSIRYATARTHLGGPLGPMAGEFEALSLERSLAAALERGAFDFVRHYGAVLTALARSLNNAAFYEVAGLWYQLMVALRSRDDQSCLDGQAASADEITQLRGKIRDRLPTARQQCRDDRVKMERLRRFDDLGEETRTTLPIDVRGLGEGTRTTLPIDVRGLNE